MFQIAGAIPRRYASPVSRYGITMSTSSAAPSLPLFLPCCTCVPPSEMHHVTGGTGHSFASTGDGFDACVWKQYYSPRRDRAIQLCLVLRCYARRRTMVASTLGLLEPRYKRSLSLALIYSDLVLLGFQLCWAVGSTSSVLQLSYRCPFYLPL